MHDHDWVRYPELTNSQMEELQYESPHPQIEWDFDATVVKVIDGDTVKLSCSFRDFVFPLRLLDINAPELNESGGQEAKEWLRSKVENQKVRIIIEPNQRVGKYGRLLGKIFYNGLDVGEEAEYLGLVKAFDTKDEGKISNLSYWTNPKQWFENA